MDVVRIFNGLGNQMSQYAFYLAKKKAHPLRTCFITNKYDSENVHNGYELGRVFGIRSCKWKERLLFRFMESHTRPFFGYKLFWHFAHFVQEADNYDFDEAMLLPSCQTGFTFFWGGWHSELYFKPLRNELLRVFRFDESKLNEGTRQWCDAIRHDDSSCSLHIRRGDFLKDSKWGNAISTDYYSRAIHYVRERSPRVHFYVFSNDVEWCRQQFGNEGFSYVDCNEGLDSWQDMFLMTLCRHHINANSTFSWWGAWLSAQDGMTIVPSAFRADVVTKDIYPGHWIKL